MTEAFIMIGNSDDKLSQQRWAEFVEAADRAIRQTSTYDGGELHGAWVSPSASPWQNACWCLHLPADRMAEEALKIHLGRLAGKYGQDSIAWALSIESEFIASDYEPADPERSVPSVPVSELPSEPARNVPSEPTSAPNERANAPRTEPNAPQVSAPSGPDQEGRE